ncbi:helix-turn-helix transcriptional regulator [Embleya scabrispora]|uniref:helix-turn-helix transcriptional regulator n=1 Tax=Embleya scabrispora TaxID=159449 RepID=UPI0039C86404
MTDVGWDAALVGRDEEVARLEEALGRGRSGDPCAVLVAGDAGVGKTRLLAEAAARAAGAGMTVLTGHCVDLGDVGLPYLPFVEVLRRLEADERHADVLAAHPAVERLLRAGGGREHAGEIPDSGVRLRLLEDVAGLLGDLAEQAPVLLVIEDLHWADQSTRDLLRFLLSRLLPQRPGAAGYQRLTVLASYRSDDLHRRHPLRPLLAELVRLPSVGRLDLRPMDDDDVARLVRGLAADPLPEDTVRAIVERAEGNAFYAQELRAATDDIDGGVPSGLAEVLLTRIEQMSSVAQRVLRTAAVAGRRVEHGLLRDAVELPDDELETALREAVGRHLLVAGEGDTYAFRHALTREAAYADLLPGERVRLHAVFARLLGEPDRRAGSSAERAHHHRAGHDLPGALSASVEAADSAARMGAPAEEMRRLEAALEVWDAVPNARELVDSDDVTLMMRASAAAVRAGEAHRAVAFARSALDRVGEHADVDLAVTVRYTLASSLMNVDNLHAAFEYSSQALAMIPADPPSRTWLWAAATHIQAAYYLNDDETARRLGHQLLAAAEELGTDDALADAIISLTGLEWGSRQAFEGRERLSQARDLAHKSGNTTIELRALFNLAMGSFESGRLAESLGWLDEGLELARRTTRSTSPYPLDMQYLRAQLLYTLGRWDEALEVVPETVPSAFRHVAEAALYVPLGRGEPGVAERARALFEERPFNWMGTLIGSLVLTDEAAWRGDSTAAAEWARRALDVLSEDRNPYPDAGIRISALALSAIGDTATELRAAGDTEAAAREVARAEQFIERARTTMSWPNRRFPRTGPESVAWLSRAEAEWSRVRGEVDVALWEKTAEAYGYGNVFEQARSELRLAQALVAADRREEATALAQRVRETAERLRAVPLRDAVDAMVRRGRLAGSAAAPADEVTLTAREREVLELLARGLSNRQIGEELFISAKTASVHVSNIMAKVGASRRTEAVALARRGGLIPD